jgi:hypothetical protein
MNAVDYYIEEVFGENFPSPPEDLPDPESEQFDELAHALTIGVIDRLESTENLGEFIRVRQCSPELQIRNMADFGYRTIFPRIHRLLLELCSGCGPMDTSIDVEHGSYEGRSILNRYPPVPLDRERKLSDDRGPGDEDTRFRSPALKGHSSSFPVRAVAVAIVFGVIAAGMAIKSILEARQTDPPARKRDEPQQQKQQQKRTPVPAQW